MVNTPYKYIAISLSIITLFFSAFVIFDHGVLDVEVGRQVAQVGGSVSDGLIAHYSFDEGSGNLAKDQTGKNNDGVFIGGVSWTDGKFGNALLFNGTDSYVSVDTSSALSGLTQFSISFWMKPWMKPSEVYSDISSVIFQRGSSYHYHGTIKIYYNPLSGTMSIGLDNGNKVFFINGCSFLDNTEWHHIALSVIPGDIKLFVDGVYCRPNFSDIAPLLGDRSVDKSGNKVYSYNMNFGAHQYSSDVPINYYKGSLDDFRIYNRPLSLSEVSVLFGKDITNLISAAFPLSFNTTPWPNIFGQVGAYGVNGTQQLKSFALAGLNLVLSSGYYGVDLKNPSALVVKEGDIKLMPNLTSKLYQICMPYVLSKAPCPLSESDKQSIIDSATVIINQSATDPNVVGYWILDDYPNADIRSVLQGIHDAVVQANKVAPFSKATVCGFGGSLDYKNDSSSNIFLNGTVVSIALTNFSPTACDIVAPYFYGATSPNDPNLIDWSMEYALPVFFSALRSKGWDQSRTPIIAVPHAFYIDGQGYVLPTTSNLVTQIEAYCKAGAIAVTPYVWHSTNVSNSLSMTPSLLQGLQQGAEICRTKYWNVSNPTPTPTPLPDPVTPTPTPDPTNPLLPTNGLCGSTLNACSKGTFSDTEDSNSQYLWMCLGLNGGQDANCAKDRFFPPPATNLSKDIPKLPRINTTYKPKTYTAPTIDIPDTPIDTTLPNIPSWLDVIVSLLNEIITNVTRGAKRVGGDVIDLVR